MFWWGDDNDDDDDNDADNKLIIKQSKQKPNKNTLLTCLICIELHIDRRGPHTCILPQLPLAPPFPEPENHMNYGMKVFK